MSSLPAQSDVDTLLRRGDECAAADDVRAAVSFYQEALATAQRSGGLTAQTMAQLRRAQSFIQDSAREFERSLDEVVEAIDTQDPAIRLRLTHALDMLRGKREIYPQQPSVLYYPYLPQRQFFERDEFEWVADLETATPTIREELVKLLEENVPFRPYIEAEENRPRRDFHGLLDDPSWSALYLWKDGALVEDNAAGCPQTVAALEKLPLSRIGRRTPSVLFSMLRPGAHIPSHHGMLNCRLICHLPLVVPPGCWLRVGNETREWQEGKLLIFDDSIAHEAKNPSQETRVILLFDVWRPELTEEEREAVSAVFDTIDRFTALPPA